MAARERLLTSQQGQCPVCLRPVDLWDSVDHEHVTGRLRGVLHARCNQLAGFAAKGGPEALARVAVYLWGDRRDGGRK